MENVTLVGDKKIRSRRSIPTISKQEPSLQAKFLCAGVAACAADLITFPLDTAKVRLQIQGEGANPTSHHTSGGSIAQATRQQFKYRGIVGTLCTITKEEGARACYQGLVPGLQRQMCFASIRIGLYDSVKKTYMNAFQVGSSGGSGVAVRILAGITTGGLAVACAQPTDVVKVRMQAQSGAGPKRYSSCLGAFRTIAKEEGIRGLWKGTCPNVARNAIVNACELVSYDLIKEFILRKNLLPDNISCHFLSAFGAGFCTTVIASPIDVVKTRFMIAGSSQYSGVMDCAAQMYRQEGPKAFYKGFFPSFMRIGSWNILMFVSFEQLKKMVTKVNQNIPEIEVKQEPRRYL